MQRKESTNSFSKRSGNRDRNKQMHRNNKEDRKNTDLKWTSQGELTNHKEKILSKEMHNFELNK